MKTESSGYWEYFEKFLEEPDKWFQRINYEVEFEQWKYETKEGKTGPRPRVSAYYKINDENIPSVIIELMSLMNERFLFESKYKDIKLDKPLDCVLVHKYRNGYDHIGWHSDREAKTTFIFGLSLGDVRKLNFRLKNKHTTKWEYLLANGSLYIMYPGCQSGFEHRIAKTVAKKQPGPRISLTFRHFSEKLQL